MEAEPEATATPKRETTPSNATPISSLPQKRPLDEDHAPNVPSPLNPNNTNNNSPVPIQISATALNPTAIAATSTGTPERKGTPGKDEGMAQTRSVRTKKDSLKKRESKGGVDSARATPDPKVPEVPSSYLPARYRLGAPKPSDFEPAKGPVFIPHHTIQLPRESGGEVEFCETSEHVYNKKHWNYSHCIADPRFPSSHYYHHTEPIPHNAHLSFQDAATHLLFDTTGHHVTTEKGFRMTRANVAVREGRWFWECRITRGIVTTKKGEQTRNNGHVRIGFSRREATLDAPVGFDAYSYGIRDKLGQKVHMSRPKAFFSAGEEIQEGDVVGLEIYLPSEHIQRKVLAGQYNPVVDSHDEEPAPDTPAGNIVRDRIPIRFKAQMLYEKIAYHTTKELEDLMNPSPSSGAGGPAQAPNPNHAVPALRTLPGSYIKAYKNGVLVGTAFEDLLCFMPPAAKPHSQPGVREGLDDGMLGYYPSVSVFRGGAVEVNFGPKFWYPPPGHEGDKNPPSGPAADEDEVDMIRSDGETSLAPNSGLPAGPVWPPSLSKVRPMQQRYVEQIAEDVIWDIIDEITYWVQDGCRIIDFTTKDEAEKRVGGAAGAVAREEIKELVQDD